MSKFWVIVSDVYKKNVKTISFWIMLLIPFIMGGIIYAVGYFASSGFADDTTTIALVTKDTTLAKTTIAAMKTQDVTVKSYDTEKAAMKELKDDNVSGVITATVADGQVTATLSTTSDLGTDKPVLLGTIFTQYQQQLQMEKLGLAASDVAALNAPATFNQKSVDFSGESDATTDDSSKGIKSIINMVMVIMIFFIVLTYASLIAQEVASEKGTRIMEVILSSTTAQTHFYGKIVGVLLVALTQFGAYIAVGLIAWPFIKAQAFVQDILGSVNFSKILGSFLVYSLIFFFLGVLIYSVLAALCGSLVSKAEDVPKAVIPVTYLSLAGYLIGISVGSADPSSIIVKVASFIPFLSSYTMPLRIASETATTAEIFISMGVLVVSTVLLTLFSAQMYKSNVLIYSEGGLLNKIKQSISMMKNEKKVNE